MIKNPITVEVVVKAPIEKVWEYWNGPEHIIHWAFASTDWEAPNAENDLRVGGRFKTHMAAKDSSESFDFTGTYTVLIEQELIEYDLSDNRHVKVVFSEVPEGVMITQTFEPENENPEEMQKTGWQAVLNNFKKYTEGENHLNTD